MENMASLVQILLRQRIVFQRILKKRFTVSNFIEKHGKIFLRTNNETASLGMHTLTSELKDDIEHASKLKNRVEQSEKLVQQKLWEQNYSI
ncbi:MAG: hypothetical protein CM15mP64_2930 [Candidatus Neomarinimicrobiota bacterium]|nr:MAG: hypothetical protein CM15mP64_2930 [Candidatus Neomarinimicrobiota bacterium]